MDNTYRFFLFLRVPFLYLVQYILYTKYIPTYSMYPFIVEFIGTTIFAYVVLATKNAIIIGATLALILLIAGNASRGGANPAILIAQVAAGNVSTRDLLPYLFSQVMGAVTAVELYRRYRI